MRRRVPGCGAVVCAVWLAATVALVPADTVIPWQSARVYEGDVVTVEGDVVRARLEADTCVLEFSASDPTSFRVVLLIPLMTDLPREPQRLYEGKRVRVSGKVRSWKGRPEMIVRSPGAIEVVGVAAAPPDTVPPSPPATVPPPATGPPPTLPPPPVAPPTTLPPPPAPPSTTLAPLAPTTTLPPPTYPPTTLPPAPAVTPPPPPATPPEQQEEAPRLPQRVDPCDAAHERWRRAAAAVEARAAELGRCLRAGSYRCRPAASAMAPALSELEWSEQQVEAACP